MRVATSLHELEGLRPYWEHLYQRGSYTVFQSFAWNRLAAECFADRLTPHVICCETAGGLALIPAAVTCDRQLTLLGEEMFDYRDVLVEGDGEALLRAWRKLAEHKFPLAFQSLAGDAALPAWQGFDLQPFAAAPQVHAAASTADQFVADHPLLARMWRKLQRAGAEVRQDDGAGADLVRWICRQKAVNHTGPGINLFIDPVRVELVVGAAAADPAACEVFTLEAGGHIVAGVITFLDFGVRRFYTICYDRAWRSFSPGNALLFEVTRRSLEQELDCDYMTGEQPYKLRLANGLMPLYRVQASAAQLADFAVRAPCVRLQAA